MDDAKIESAPEDQAKAEEKAAGDAVEEALAVVADIEPQPKKRGRPRSQVGDIGSSSSWQFLSDNPLDGNVPESVKFGHETIAETLSAIIRNCPTPFTIGLFGTWGTGKSTVINLAKKLLPELEGSIVEFDVWKYEHDRHRDHSSDRFSRRV